MGRDPPKSRMWIIYAFLGVTFMGCFNYFVGTYNRNPIGGKVINSLCLGIGALCIHIYQKVYLSNVDNETDKTYTEIMKKSRKTIVTELLEQTLSHDSPHAKHEYTPVENYEVVESFETP